MHRRQCQCGCDQWFDTRYKDQKFMNGAHLTRYRASQPPSDQRTHRKRCLGCGQVKRMIRRAKTCSRACEAIRRKAAGIYRAMNEKSHIARRRPVELAGFGPLTPREQAIYQQGRNNALSYARWKRRDEFRRLGIAIDGVA